MIPTYILLSTNTYVHNQAKGADFWAGLELEPPRGKVCSTYHLTDTYTCSVLPDQQRRSPPCTAPRKPFRKSHRWNPLSVYCTPLLRTWEGQSMYMRRLESKTHGEGWRIVVIVEANGHKTRQSFVVENFNSRFWPWPCTNLNRPRSIYQYSNIASIEAVRKSIYIGDLVLFSLYASLFWELRDERNLKSLKFWPESLGALLEYW